jgi:hypothetical protein
MKPKTSVPVKTASKPETVRAVRSSLARSGGVAEGGKGGPHKTFGKGDHTVTAPSDAANEQAPAVTGHKTPGESLKRATGGPPVRSHSLGGVSKPAKPGTCGT